MADRHYISSAVFDIDVIEEIVFSNKKLALSEEAKMNINKSRNYLDEKLNNSEAPFYGINTGFGSLHNVKISREKLSQLQKNLVMSHASGTGDKVSKPIIRLMLLLKIKSLSYGNSGITEEVVLRLIDFYNQDILPVIYEQGSLGASGDLAPLAHLSLPLLGMGEVYYKEEIRPAAGVLKEMAWEPLELRSKEGLALLNGTQFMSAHAVYALQKAYKLSELSDLIAAISADAFDCSLAPFDSLIHQIRPHRGQVKTAANIFNYLKDSPIANQPKYEVQDPYSFRCIPQVHGASKDTLAHVNQVVKTEINSVTDNPNIFPKYDKIISGGNFHGQPLALALDFLAIAMAEIGNISERRVYKLVSGKRNLPEFLVHNPGLNNGFMIPQYTAASIVSQNKQLCTPSSIDSITSSNGQEDHVSMGANAATKLIKVMDNLQTILAIELFNASQALHFREPMQSSDLIMKIVEDFRKVVPIMTKDKIMAEEIRKANTFIEELDMKTYL
ncbi:MAG TPA: histidine ammonia-lyase [Flavobacteriaceae bacterium]|nr:histidine ammonia-lyase [Flavobacteriaceae bacterium]